MEISKWISAEVLDNRISFDRTIDPNNSEELARGVIRIKFKNEKMSKVVKYAYPANPYDQQIPLIGEIIICAQFLSNTAGPFNRTRRWYYLNILIIWDNSFP